MKNTAGGFAHLRSRSLATSAVTVIAAALAASASAQTSGANNTQGGGAVGIESVVVSVDRRDVSVQNTPNTIQAFTGDTLQQLNVSSFNDLMKYTPNVTFSGSGPGMGNIFMRGLSAGSSGNQGSAATGPFPNVGVFLDDQSMAFPGRNLDVYVVDMQRVEVLEGPQGTLFGGGAEAGAIRYITNKPKLNVFEGSGEASYGTTTDGGPSTSINATLNIPVLDDKLAIRAVIFNDRRGGYIDNIPSTLSLPVPNSPVTNNNALVGTDTNPLTYTGMRLSALYQVNNDWSLLIQQSYQNMDAQGYFQQYPVGSAGQKLGPDQITAFTPAYDKDRYDSTSWTINGKISDLNIVYTGSYLKRHIEQQQDYANYLRTAGGAYYACTGGAGSGNLGDGAYPSSQALSCYAPNGSWHDEVQSTHQSHELRLSTPDDWRFRAIGGAYWERLGIADQADFNYLSVPQCTPANLATANAGGPACVSAVGPNPNSPAVLPGLRSSTTAFGEDIQRGYQQTALFASFDYDLIPNVLTFTAGTRYFQYNEYEKGSLYATSSDCVDVPNGTCLAAPINKSVTYHGFKSRANITWHIDSDTMAYATWSEGFRPGALNRTQSNVANLNAKAPTFPQYQKPSGFAPDTLTNYEAGVKTSFWDHRIEANLSGYIMDWKNVQMLFFNPTALGNTTFGVNGPNYEIKGIELQLFARVAEGLSLQGSGSYNDAVQTNSPCLVSNVATSPTLGKCITTVKGAPFVNPFGALGTRPAFSPDLQFNVRARYDWTLASDYAAFVSAGVSYIGDMFNQPATYPEGDVPSQAIPTTALLKYLQPAYTTMDASFGVSKGNWNVQLSGSNLTNSNASTYTGSNQFIKAEIPLRPRTIELQLGYKF